MTNNLISKIKPELQPFYRLGGALAPLVGHDQDLAVRAFNVLGSVIPLTALKRILHTSLHNTICGIPDAKMNNEQECTVIIGYYHAKAML